MKLTSRFVSLLAILVFCSPMLAQAGWEGEPIDPPWRFHSTQDGRGSLNITDLENGRQIIVGSSLPPVVQNGITPVIQMHARPNGADMVFTFTNTTGSAQPVGALVLGGIRMHGNISQRTFYQDASPRAVPGYTFANEWRYPWDIYSPVQVISDGTYILGFSLLYPVVDYDHIAGVALVGIHGPGAPGGPHWSQQFRMNEVMIPPGATRSYTVAVRIALAGESFLTTLLPYRAHYRSIYGPVRYQRDTRRPTGDTVSHVSDIGPGNPNGFRHANMRPDQYGWAPWVNRVLGAQSQGYQRVMLWTPSGVLPPSYNLNFPFRFMTPIDDFPVARVTMPEFLRVGQAGMALGFWWGNSSTLMQGWIPTIADEFDPDNPQHRALAFAELDMAVQAGATMIGLDAFKMRSPAKNYRWLQMMQARAPAVQFITENALSDYMHNLAPTFHEAETITTPHPLGDFLNPGHETWAAVQSTPESRAAGRAPTQEEMHREMQRVENLGYVPLAYGSGATAAPPSGPAITNQPLEVTVPEGTSATLSVAVGQAQGGVTYRWRKNGIAISDGPLPGAQSVTGSSSPTLRINGAGSGAVAVYSVLVSDGAGHSASLAATLLIGEGPPPCPADFNGDGFRNPDDLADFITMFFSGPAGPGSPADFNRDGTVNPDDLADFITVFFVAPCG